MHQSPLKTRPGERDRHAGRELDDGSERMFRKGGQPKARKSALREEDFAREARRDREFSTRDR